MLVEATGCGGDERVVDGASMVLNGGSERPTVFVGSDTLTTIFLLVEGLVVADPDGFASDLGDGTEAAASAAFEIEAIALSGGKVTGNGHIVCGLLADTLVGVGNTFDGCTLADADARIDVVDATVEFMLTDCDGFTTAKLGVELITGCCLLGKDGIGLRGGSASGVFVVGLDWFIDCSTVDEDVGVETLRDGEAETIGEALAEEEGAFVRFGAMDAVTFGQSSGEFCDDKGCALAEPEAPTAAIFNGAADRDGNGVSCGE